MFANHRNQSSFGHLVKNVTVNFGADLYPRLSQKRPRLFRNMPAGGLNLDLAYLDTRQDGKEYRKVLMAFHGMPATYETFNKLIEHYVDSDVRVIVPNFPTFTETRQHNFWHFTSEKIALMESFLAKINVNSIDCAVCHSYGVHAMAGLWDKVVLVSRIPTNHCSFPLPQASPIQVKSVALIAPQTLLDFPQYQLRNTKYFFLFIANWWYDFLGLINFHKAPIFPIKFNNIDDCLHFMSGTFDEEQIGLAEMTDRLKQIPEQGIPALLLFGSKEAMVSRRGQAMIRDLLEIPHEQVVTYQCDTANLEQVKLNHTRNSVVILGSRHFVHSLYPDITNKLIDELLLKVP